MISCPTCERSHRDEGALEKCKLRAEKRAEREQAKKDDAKRRWKNAKDTPVDVLIPRLVRDGQPWERIVTKLNRDYPPKPDGGKWTLWDVVWVDSASLMRTWNKDQEAITELRLQKHMVGDYLSRTEGVA